MSGVSVSLGDPRLTAGLVARTTARPRPTRAFDPRSDLAQPAECLLWRDERGGLFGRGVALRLDLPRGLADRSSVSRLGEILAGIASEDEVGLPGCGPVAVGALPFDPTVPATLVVPRTIIGWRDGQCWETSIGRLEGRRPHHLEPDNPAPSTGESPDGFTLSSTSHRQWRASVAAAVEKIRAGSFDKVVLARRVEVRANRPFVIGDVLARLIALYPSCMVFHVDGFLGASPELLIRRVGCRVTSHPLAGTVARSGDLASDKELVNMLLSSPKERWEHQLVVDALAHALGPRCVSIDVPDRPSVLGLRNVSHLATHITGVLPDRGDAPTALQLLADIHPTPAVAGVPRSAAIDYQREVEGFDRGRYAGPVGWVDARGDGAWALGIRSAEVAGAHASLFAGVGVVADSDPAAELAETQLKLQALLAALVRP